MASLSIVWVVIPAFNEEKTLGDVIASLKREGFENIVVVDDGSNDRTGEIAEHFGGVVLRHLMNRGLGAALGTGFAYCLEKRAGVVLTIDGDGQHLAKDAIEVLRPILDGEAAVVLGARKKYLGTFPKGRFFLNLVANVLTYSLFGIWVSDSQCGLRALSYKALSKMELNSNGMEVSSEIVAEIKRWGFKFKEVPIHPVYTSYSLGKGQRVVNSFKVARKLILRRLGV